MPETDLTRDGASAGTEERSLLRLSREAVDIALAGDIKRGLALALEASSQARVAGDREAELAALNAAARCHSLRNDAINSLAAGIDAAALARSLGDGVALGHALCAIVNTSFTMKLLGECEEVVVRAIDEGLKHGDHDLESRARQAYGVLLGDLARFDGARSQLELAVAAARRDGRAALLLRVEGSLAHLSRKVARQHADRGETDQLRAVGLRALEEAASVLERAREQQVISVEMNMTGMIGEMHWLLGDVERGIAETTRAMELAQRSRQPANLPPLGLRLGSMLRERDRLPEAIEALHRGLYAAETLRPTFRIAEICEVIAGVETLRGDATAAAEWHERANKESEQFESGRQMAAGFLKRLRADLGHSSGD